MTTDTIQVRNPATLQPLAELPVALPADVAAAVALARQAQTHWQSKSFAVRGKILRRLRDLLIDEQERLADILTSESGKPRGEVYGNELFYVCDAIGFWVKNAEKWLSPQKIRPHLFKMKKVLSMHQPLGVIGIISPWNFPLVLTAGDAVPALMAGNAVVIKPSELTPLTALFVAELAQKAGFPENLLQVMIGGSETGEALVDNVDMIAFTGSVDVGRHVMRRAADRLIPVSLELGGKDPLIVLKDADLERAANACVWGALVNSGQVCTSIERVYVEEPIYPIFVDKIVERVKRLRQGQSRDEVELGSMTSEEQFKKVAAQVNDAVAKGAKILTGGRTHPSFSGLYYEPTVLVDVTHEMAIIQEETFGPVIPIMKVKNADEAVQLANDSRYGLDACVFTRDRQKAWQMAQSLHTGTVCINDGLVNYIIPDAPMGGVKDSGFSRRHGAEGIRKYCYQKTIVIDRFGMKNELPWFPSSRKKTAQMRRMINLLWRSGWRNKFRPPRQFR
ncbi:MAG: aldehyde dehydrogenase family protein [Deltaproteobacteria bacterium]|nr:aldehyde dehydrogenase family protein [Deltaproteobacteria bacterium]